MVMVLLLIACERPVPVTEDAGPRIEALERDIAELQGQIETLEAAPKGARRSPATVKLDMADASVHDLAVFTAGIHRVELVIADGTARDRAVRIRSTAPTSVDATWAATAAAFTTAGVRAILDDRQLALSPADDDLVPGATTWLLLRDGIDEGDLRDAAGPDALFGDTSEVFVISVPPDRSSAVEALVL